MTKKSTNMETCSACPVEAAPVNFESIIGTNAGRIWHFLSQNGESSANRIGSVLRLTERELHQALGWLAREGKLSAVQTNRGERLNLT
jgi:hypothetical protein